jgi:hypothetical protein
MVHAFNPHAASDDAFDRGTLPHLVAGNRGRLLDPRRTPVTILSIDLETGQFTVRIEDFEDRGATWEIPFERVDRYQFEKSARRAQAEIAAFEAAVARFDRPLEIACDARARESTLARIARWREDARAWFERRVSLSARLNAFDPARRESAGAFAAECEAFMRERGLWDLEDAFTARWVSNPNSGELVKGHRIVCAQLGLAPFIGRIVRSAALFDDSWTRERRAEHIECRAGFTQALFAAGGHERVTLYRGLASEGAPSAPRSETFVSATFDIEVASSMMGARDASRTGVLLSQDVPIERLFMTCVETAAMNRQFREAEAVLFWEAGNTPF